MELLKEFRIWITAVCRAWYGWVGASATVGIVGFGQGMGWWVTSKFVYVSLVLLGLLSSLFQAWRKEHQTIIAISDQMSGLENAYFDKRPVIGFYIAGPEGPRAWKEAVGSEACWFYLSQLSGRTAKSVRVDPIQSKKGAYTLCFDYVPFLEPPRSTPLKYHIIQVGFPAPSAHAKDRIGDIEGQMLRVFLEDSPRELVELSYVMTVRLKDKLDEDRVQEFNVIFDKSRWAFLPVVQP